MKWNREYPTFDQYYELQDKPLAVLLVECDELGQPKKNQIILSATAETGWLDMDYIWFDFKNIGGLEYERNLYDHVSGDRIEDTENYLTVRHDRWSDRKDTYYMFVGWAEIEEYQVETNQGAP